MDNIFFSIVVPTYNRAHILENTLTSLLSIAGSNYEIIVVDDGSTDDTFNVVSRFENSKLTYHKKINAERGAARNYGAQLAKGQYINFFDSDDIAYNNHIAEAAKAVQLYNKPEIFHLAYDVKNAHGKILRTVNNLPATINNVLISGNYLSCNGVFIRKDICHQFPFSENRLLSASEDYELWLRLASRFSIYSYNVITSTVINHEERSVLQIKLETFLARMRVLQENLIKDDAFNKKYGSQINLFKSYVNIYIALHLAIANYPKKLSFSYLLLAVKYRPTVLLTRRFLAALKNIYV